MNVLPVIRWCTPQCVLDVANGVCWSDVPPSMHDRLAADLRTLVMDERLPLIDREHPPKKPKSTPKFNNAPDIPQVVLDVLNDVDWTQLSIAQQKQLAKRLSAFIYGPIGKLLYNLPRRIWS